MKNMFYLKTALVCIFFTLFTASFSLKSQMFHIETETRLVGASMKTIKVSSGIECAMICTNDNNCCFSTYDTNLEHCSLFLECCPDKEFSKESQTLKKISDKSLRCFPGWKEYANHCYNFVSTQVTWNEAERACRKIGGYLVKVDNESESNWLKQPANVEEKSFWAGAADFNEGDWRWIVDFSSVTYTDWSSGQPDNARGHEDCLEIEKAYNYQWNDAQCTVSMGYICESEKGGACIPYSKLFRK